MSGWRSGWHRGSRSCLAGGVASTRSILSASMDPCMNWWHLGGVGTHVQPHWSNSSPHVTSSLMQIRTSLASVSLSHHSGSRAWPACVGVWKAAALSCLFPGLRKKQKLPGGSGAQVQPRVLSTQKSGLEPAAGRPQKTLYSLRSNHGFR